MGEAEIVPGGGELATGETPVEVMTSRATRSSIARPCRCGREDAGQVRGVAVGGAGNVGAWRHR